MFICFFICLFVGKPKSIPFQIIKITNSIILLDVSRLQFDVPRVASSESKHDVAILTRDRRTVNGFGFDFPSPVARDIQIIATCSQQGGLV